jgi:beta-N-acetylhexosaminidase
MKAAIVGIAGPTFDPAEAALFRAHPPAGVILFARNVADPVQLAALTAALRAVLPDGAVLMVDQEGGRVARLRPPHWRAHPPAAAIGALFARDEANGLRAAWLTGALIGLDCATAGFDVVAAPVLDLGLPGAHSVIGDRAYAEDPQVVARLGRAMAEGLLAAGIQPIGKHAPGHGRARLDSHLALPTVDVHDLAADLLPFALNADLPWAMTAHILYPAWDAMRPATLSPVVIDSVIRRRIGFEGVLVTDDLAMRALSGAPAVLAQQALAAGCDLALYCAGDAAPTAALLAACPDVTSAAAQRLARARALAAGRRVTLDSAALANERDRLLA